MNFYNKILAGFVALVVTILFWPLELTFYENASIFLMVYLMITFIVSTGVSYELLLMPVILLTFECLIMPSIVYNVYNNEYFVLMLKYNMSIPKEVYFSFLFPATIAMMIGLLIPFQRKSIQTKKIKRAVTDCKEYLKGRENLGVLLIIIGAASGVLDIITPSELDYVLYLFGRLILIGSLYVYYSDSKNKKLYLIGAITFIFIQSLMQGMFGDLIYTMILGGMLVLLGTKIRNYIKFSIVGFGLIVIMLIQSIKEDYRMIAWYGKTDRKGNDSFISLVIDRLNNPDQFFDKYAMFPTVNRFNQGMIVSKVMEYIPNSKPYADGESIYKSVASTFVPRILWPDKPTAGGHYNILRFTGYELIGYSMNIGVIGEAYGNFGKNGGIAFMFFYGLLFNLILLFLVNACKKRPTIILWIPFIFLNAIQAETDTLMTVNSTIKNILFMFFIFWGANRFLRLKL